MSMFTDKEGKFQPLWAFFVSVLLSALAYFVSGNIAHEAGDQRPFRIEFIFRGLWVLLLLGIFVWLLTVGDHIEEHRLAAQGLPRVRGWLKQFVIGCALGAGLTILAVAPIFFLGRFQFHTLMKMQLLPNLGAVLLMLLFGALAEELVFRGYPFQHLVQAIGPASALLVFSILYGVLHLLNPWGNRWGVGSSMLIGVLLSLAYLRTRALWLPWGIHFGWNTTLGLVFGLPVSGFRVFNLWTYADAFGPKWLTGGHYGAEATVNGAAAMLIGILLVWKLPFRALEQPGSTSAAQPALHDTVSSIQA